jgi:hypothetical protein
VASFFEFLTHDFNRLKNKRKAGALRRKILSYDPRSPKIMRKPNFDLRPNANTPTQSGNTASIGWKGELLLLTI